MSSTVVVIPTYNELENLPLIVGRIFEFQPHVDILIVDDNSPDGTGDLAEKLSLDEPSIHVLRREGKQGLGTAYRAGFAWALARNYDVICEMDADGSHRPEDLGKLLAVDADLVLGSRWVPGGSVVNWPKKRELLSRAASAYSRLMLGIRVKDATAGFRAFKREALAAIDLDDVASQGYCFQIDMTRRVRALGLSVAEVPITFVEREIGQSKMTWEIVREAMVNVTVWGFGRLFSR